MLSCPSSIQSGRAFNPTKYTYDAFGNLRGASIYGKEISYMVDGQDRRVAKLGWGNVELRYIWQDQLRLAAELYPDGTISKQFIYAEGVNSPEYMIFQGRKYFFVKDHRGSILQVVDVATGELKQQMKYSEFGEVLQDTNPGFQPFGFAGGLYDHETKLVRFGARDYDGSIGRWLSKDPIRFNGGDTNLYGYVLNDPINRMDSRGLMTEDEAKCLQDAAETYYAKKRAGSNSCEQEHTIDVAVCFQDAKGWDNLDASEYDTLDDFERSHDEYKDLLEVVREP